MVHVGHEKNMKREIIILAVMSCACLTMTSCQNHTVSPQPSALSEVHMTAVDFDNAKARFKASPGNRSKEARMLAPTITAGMTKKQVRDILGEPDKKGALASSETVWNYTVFYSQYISVTFEKDRVTRTVGIGIE